MSGSRHKSSAKHLRHLESESAKAAAVEITAAAAGPAALVVANTDSLSHGHMITCGWESCTYTCTPGRAHDMKKHQATHDVKPPSVNCTKCGASVQDINKHQKAVRMNGLTACANAQRKRKAEADAM